MRSFIEYVILIAAIIIGFMLTAGATGAAVKFWFDIMG